MYRLMLVPLSIFCVHRSPTPRPPQSLTTHM
jgi:hypothetical protein